MLPRFISIVAVLLIAITALGWLVPRGRRSSQPVASRLEFVPIIGFLGAILLALGFVEATRREVMEAWRWGIAFGFLVSACLALAILYRANRMITDGASGLGTWVRIAQTYGLVLLIAILGVIIGVRVIGALLEVFIASALGTLVIAVAIGVFAAQWRKRGLGEG